MIDECNRLYNTGTNSIPMNLKLVAATEDPAGNPPGRNPASNAS